MTDKEKNFAILSKLYEFADEIWENVEDKRAGVFTASEIARSIKSCKDVIVCFGDLGDEQITFEVESFSCSIPKSLIFDYIRIFERLAGVGDKKAKTFVHAEDTGDVLGSCKFELTKDFADLVKFAAKVISSRPAKENARKTPSMASCGKDMEGTARGKRFSFEAVGVNVGDKLSFIDGTEVVAADGNKVEFCGEVFTLSGFCKEFMPDDRRTKSNSYRGCNFFFLDGVCLGKLFRDVMEAAPDVPPVIEGTESVTLEIQGTDGIPEKGHISHEANNFGHKECEEKPNEGQTMRSDGKKSIQPTDTPFVARKRNTGRFWPLFGGVATMEAVVFRRVVANVLRRSGPIFADGRVRPPPHFAHNEGRMNSFRFYNNFKISKE